MGDVTFELLGYSVLSRKAATDDGSRSTAEVDVSVGGEVVKGSARGYGPVDALEKALRAALVPTFPVLADVVLVDFMSGLVEPRGDGRAAVRVSVTATLPTGGSWEAQGRAADLLHAAWLAVGEAMAMVVEATPTPTVVDAGARRYPSVPEIARVLHGAVGPDDQAVLDRLAATDWSATVLDIESKEDRWFAAHAAELGATVFSSFGNFCAVAAHPRIESIQRVNVQKGRPVNQVGSVTTTRDRFAALFDWEALPPGLSQEQVLALMDAFFELGPMGFRGPAAWTVSNQLTSFDAEVKTTQLIGPGYRCPSNQLIDQVLGFAGREYVFATPANVSSGRTGQVEPAHYDMAGIQADFGAEEGVVFIGHRDEAAVRASYPKHLPMSTSILAFHKVVDGGLVLERLGSLDAGEVEAVLSGHGFGLVIGPGARERLPMRA